MTPAPTSLLRALPAIATCTVCARDQATQVFDPELNGRVCPACAPHLGVADYVLNNTPWLTRPLGLGLTNFTTNNLRTT